MRVDGIKQQLSVIQEWWQNRSNFDLYAKGNRLVKISNKGDLRSWFGRIVKWVFGYRKCDVSGKINALVTQAFLEEITSSEREEVSKLVTSLKSGGIDVLEAAGAIAQKVGIVPLFAPFDAQQYAKQLIGKKTEERELTVLFETLQEMLLKEIEKQKPKDERETETLVNRILDKAREKENRGKWDLLTRLLIQRSAAFHVELLRLEERITWDVSTPQFQNQIEESIQGADLKRAYDAVKNQIWKS